VSKNKTPKSKEVSSRKNPKAVIKPDSYYSKTPAWRFSRIDDGHDKWSFSKNDVFEDRDILKRLSDFEKQTWGEIIGSRNHFINIEDFIKEASDRALEIKLYYDRLFSLTIDGKGRIFGVLEDGVFSFVWYDKAHEICPNPKKHT
jgi:hypothetical protein